MATLRTFSDEDENDLSMTSSVYANAAAPASSSGERRHQQIYFEKFNHGDPAGKSGLVAGGGGQSSDADVAPVAAAKSFHPTSTNTPNSRVSELKVVKVFPPLKSNDVFNQINR